MNKFLLSVVVVAVVAIALGSAGVAFAQSNTPQTPVPGTGYGMGGRGNRGGMMGENVYGTQDGLLHDEMIAIYSEKLGISVEELNSRLANGETLSAIALSKGLTFEQFRTLMLNARNQTLDQAVKSGTLTQAQAEWMKTRGAGVANGGTGMRGAGYGQGQFTNADCPYFEN
jgi:hypothetical protein